MSVIIWPDDLWFDDDRSMLIDGFSAGPPDARIVSKMARGWPKVRPAGTIALKPVVVQTYYTDDQRARLDCFWRDTLMSGVLSFLIPNQMLHGLRLTNGATFMVDELGQQLTMGDHWLATFSGEKPTYAKETATVYRVTMPLEIYEDA